MAFLILAGARLARHLRRIGLGARGGACRMLQAEGVGRLPEHAAGQS
jgi:hypothetical protein